MKEKAVIDSITEGKATILIGEEERELVLQIDQFPKSETFKEGDWIQVQISDNLITVIGKDEEETSKREKRVQDKMERLRNRNNESI